MRTILVAIFSLLTIYISAQSRHIPESAPLYHGMTTESAISYCDSSPLRDPEGLYIWPENGSLVLIRASQNGSYAPNEYEITVIESDDILLAPGQVIGYLHNSASPSEYHLYIYRKITRKGVSKPQHIAAKYDKSNHSFSFKQKKLKITFNPLGLIPRVRSLLRINSDNPVNDIPTGLIRVYPATPGTSPGAYPRYF